MMKSMVQGLAAWLFSRTANRLYSVVTAGLAALLMFSLPNRVVQYDHPLRTAGFLAMALCAVISIRIAGSERALGRYRRRPRRRALAQRAVASDATSSRAASEDFIAYARSMARDRFTPDVLSHLALTLITPSSQTVRISESFEVHDDALAVTTTRTLLLPKSPSLIPVHRARKGVLVDDFTILIDGSPGSTLSYLESQGVVAVVVESLFRVAYQDSAENLEHRRVLKEILVLACSPTATSKTQREALTSSMEALPTDPTRQAEVRRFRSVVTEVIDSYFIFAIKESERTRVKVQTCYTLAQPYRLRGVKNRVSSALGLSTRTHAFLLPNATDAPSYHVRVALPEGLYVYDTSLVPVADRSGVTLRAGAVTPHDNRPRHPHFTAKGSRGRAFIHGYVRDVDSAQLSPAGPTGAPQSASYVHFRLLAEFRERPPGMLALVGLLSVYLAALTFGVAHFHDLVFPLNVADREGLNPGQVSNWPTILFGIPAIVSGWLVSRFTPENLSRISLVTTAMTAWLVANAGIAVAVAAVKSSGGEPNTFFIHNTTIYHATWAALTGSCLVHLTLAAIMLVCRTSRYWLRANG